MMYLNPGRQGLIGAPTFPMLRDSTQTALFEVLESNRISFDFNKSENQMVLPDSGARVIFRSLDEYERLRGTNLAWFGVDELTYTCAEAWLRLEGRLRDPKAKRLAGFGVWTPKGFDWVYERFIANAVAGYEAVIARPKENRHLLKQVPDFYDRLKSSYDDRFFKQEVLGEYLNMAAGRVYYAFDRAKHLARKEPDRSRPILWALDFNVNPMSSIIAQMIGDSVVVLDEIVLNRASTLDACQEFRQRFKYHPAGIEVFGDATGARMQTAGTTDYEIVEEFLRRYGYQYVLKVGRSNPQVRDRVGNVNSMLESADGTVRLFVHPGCKELIRDLEQVSYQGNTMMIDKLSDPKRTHLSDALGYLLWQECRLSTAGERPDRLF
jgi:hypothetical protein